MENVQTVLVQVAAANVDEASGPQGLLAELEEHRTSLQRQPGFQGVRITHSINAEGNMQLAVETRWQDRDSLVRYQSAEANVRSIIDRHQAIVIPDTLQVLETEASSGDARPESADVRERLLLPLLVPLGVFFFGVLVIYGLSRVYLEVPNEVATPMALAIATGILLVSWYLASNPNVPRWQVGGIVVVVAALLLGGGIFAAVHEDEGGTEAAPQAAESPEAGASPAPAASPAAEASPQGAPAGALTIAMVPTILFDKTELTAASGTDITVHFDNQDTGQPHNWAIYTDDSAAEPIAGANENICTAPCSADVTFGPLDPGEYFFRCDVHPVQMLGTFTVE